VKDQVDNAKAGIANGSIIVPRNTTENPPTDPESIPVPPTITTTSQTIDEDNIDLHWTSTLETGTYHVYIDDTEFGNTTATTKNIEFVGNGTYTITVTAKNSLGESPKSESISIIVAIPPEGSEPPDTPVIPGYNNIILIFTLIASIGILAYVTKKKSKLF
jgi:predicted phage tail protein